MPSGITSDIYEGRPVTLRDYLMRVGRGMGYAIMQRDSDPNEPVKPTDTPTSHYDEDIARHEARIAELDAMSLGEAEEAAARDHVQRHARWVELRAEKEAVRGRYEAMIAEVEGWEPDPLIASTKEAALKYLRDSIGFDCGSPQELDRFYPEPQALDGPTWRHMQIEEATRSLAYSQKHRQEDLEREAERNRYIQAFLNSLPPAEADAAKAAA